MLDLFECADGSGDGMVGTADLDLVRANWGTEVYPGDVTRGDYTSDGLVNSDDLDLVREQWGQDTFLDGIFGVDLLCAGVDMYAILSGESGGDPFFQQVHFDFRDWENGNGAMVLDLSASYDNVITPASAVPEPGLGVLLLGGLLLCARATRVVCRS